MIAKLLIAKKLATVAALSALALADGVMTNRNHARGAREMNPLVRPVVGTGGVYAATQIDVAVTGVLIFMRPQSKLAKAAVAETTASHSWGVVTNLRYRPASLNVVCTRYGVHGADEECHYQGLAGRLH
jgi:hypothetical protein